MSDPRQLLTDAWDRLSGDQRDEVMGLAVELWRESLSASRVRQEKGLFACRKCGAENTVVMEVELPDIVTRSKAFEILANQAYGKPLESRVVSVDVGERTLEALEAMSMRELASVAGVVDAEWAELPPAA